MIPLHAGLPLSEVLDLLERERADRINKHIETFGRSLAARVYDVQRAIEEGLISHTDARRLLEIPA